MTAPVTQAAVAGGVRVQFVLPKGVTLDTTPEPLDARGQLRLVPASQWAAIRYCASILMAKDADLYTVSKILGHSTITTTQRYAHLAMSQQRAALKRAYE